MLTHPFDWKASPLFSSIKRFLMTTRFHRELLFLQAHRNESRVVRCKFCVFQCRRIFRSEPFWRVATGFRELRQDLEGFLSAEREKARRNVPFGRNKRTRKKESFSARREITFTAQKGGLISRVAETIPRKSRWFRWHGRRRPAKRYGGREFLLAFFFSSIAFFRTSSRLISNVHFCVTS